MKLGVYLWLILLTGCASLTPQRMNESEFSEHLRLLIDEAERTSIDSSDGISEIEAFKIASDYFFQPGVARCGMVAPPKDEGSFWRVTLLEGMLPAPWKYVLIDKARGAYHIKDIPRSKPNPQVETTPIPRSETWKDHFNPDAPRGVSHH